MAGNVIELTDDNFKKEIEESLGVCLVDFWAEWCAPCRMVAPTIAALAEAYVGKAKIGNLDADAHRETAARFGITAIPMLILFKNGQPAKRFVGVTSQEDLKAALDEALA